MKFEENGQASWHIVTDAYHRPLASLIAQSTELAAGGWRSTVMRWCGSGATALVNWHSSGRARRRGPLTKQEQAAVQVVVNYDADDEGKGRGKVG